MIVQASTFHLKPYFMKYYIRYLLEHNVPNCMQLLTCVIGFFENDLLDLSSDTSKRVSAALELTTV